MAAELKVFRNDSPRPNVVAALQGALDAAKAGRVLSVAIAYVDTDDLTHTEYANDSDRSGRRSLVASVALLSHRLVSAWNDD